MIFWGSPGGGGGGSISISKPNGTFGMPFLFKKKTLFQLSVICQSYFLYCGELFVRCWRGRGFHKAGAVPSKTPR